MSVPDNLTMNNARRFATADCPHCFGCGWVIGGRSRNGDLIADICQCAWDAYCAAVLAEEGIEA